jgi:probable rRNA maturation factor
VIINQLNQSRVRMPRKFIDSWVRASIKALKSQHVHIPLKPEITIVFMDAKPARALNLQFRQRDYATDVLSFVGDGELVLGELLLCPQVMDRQAKDHELSFRQELGYMILHGILHLLGYDHEQNEKDAERMFAIQDKAFDQLCRKFWK